jgi:hypothetical protein
MTATKPETIVVTDATTKAELAEALTNMAATAARTPAHWAERKAAIHARIDALLYEYENAPGVSHVPDDCPSCARGQEPTSGIARR